MTVGVGLVGRKVGMTRIFTEEGTSIPVSVIEVLPNRITQIKTLDHDGYDAIQITTGMKKVSRLNKPLLGHYKKANVAPGEGLWEFRIESSKIGEYKLGSELDLAVFETGQKVDIIGVSKGKGFAGVIKRHHFASQDSTHGNSLSHRAPGSIGQRQSPGKVFKGKRMAGRLGNTRVTAPNLTVVKIDKEKSLLMVFGAIPGAPSSRVIIYPTKKKKSSSAKRSD